MQALIIDMNASRLNQGLISLMESGIAASGTAQMAVAETCLVSVPLDLLILDGDGLADALGDTIGIAEEHNPDLVTVLRSFDPARDLADLPEHFPSIQAIISADAPCELVAHLLKCMSMPPPAVEPEAAVETPEPEVEAEDDLAEVDTPENRAGAKRLFPWLFGMGGRLRWKRAA